MRLAALLAILVLAVPVGAQTFTVASSAPADHAANVPTTTSIALTFSAPVSATAAPVLATFPTGAVTLGTPVRSADMRTLTYPATLPAATRVVVLVLGATSEAGDGLTTPFALNLNTGPSNGPLTVRGSITGTGGVVPGGSIVALVTGDIAAGTIEIVAADVVEGAGASLPYALGPVAFGLYSAGAVRIPLPLGSTAGGAGYGLYDPDGDGTPNPILSPTGVNIVVAPPPPRTAAEDFAGTVAAANGALGAPASFVAVEPTVTDATGGAAAWSYRFEDSATGDETRIVRLGAFTLPVAVATPTAGDVPLPTPFFDSPQTLASVEAQGGAAFRAAHAAETVVVTLESMFTSVPEWKATYRASGGDEATFRAPFAADLAGEPGAAAPARLALRSANPTRDGVTVALVLDAPGDVRVSVLDVRGRLVARLVDGPVGAGEASLRWTPASGVAAGVYRIVAETAGGTSAVAVTVVR